MRKAGESNDSFNGNNNSSNRRNKRDSDKKADAWINIRAVKDTGGNEHSLSFLNAYGVPLDLDVHGLTDRLINAAKNSPDGRITVNLVAEIQFVQQKDADTTDYSNVDF